MQRSNNDIKKSEACTQNFIFSNGKGGNNDGTPTDLSFLINWFNFKRLKADHSCQVLKSENMFMKLLFLEFYNGILYGSCP